MQTYKTQKQLQAALETLSASDKKLAAAFQEYGTPPMRPLAEGFIGLTRILISQQVSTAAAATIQARFEALLDEDDEAHAPHALLALPEEDVRACGISRAKQSYMRHLAEAVVSGALNVAARRRGFYGLIIMANRRKTASPITRRLSCMKRADMSHFRLRVILGIIKERGMIR